MKSLLALMRFDMLSPRLLRYVFVPFDIPNKF